MDSLSRRETAASSYTLRDSSRYAKTRARSDFDDMSSVEHDVIMASTRGAGLSRQAAIPFAFGSIAGSGLEPAVAMYSEAGATEPVGVGDGRAECVPMLLMFQERSGSRPTEQR